MSAALLLVIAPAASAAGLGKLVVLSAMGEPFRAEIELLVSPGPYLAPTPRLAPPELYRLTDYRYNPALSGSRLDIRTHSNGRHVIEVMSPRPLNEPFVYLLVELESDATRIVRAYTVLLDPQGYGRPQAVSAAEFLPAVTPVTGAAPVSAVPHPANRVAAVSSANDGRQNRHMEAQLDAGAKKLAGMIDRVAALELAVAQMQRALELQQADVAVRRPVAEEAAARKAPAANMMPVAVAVETPPHTAQGRDSLLNEALLALVVGLLALLAGLVWMIWGRPPVKARQPQGDV